MHKALLLVMASEYIFTGFTGFSGRGGRGGRGLRTEHISTLAAWQTVKRYAKQCELPHVKPHDFRRFVGTILAKKDPRQAQKVLGHKSIDTTYKHYVLARLCTFLALYQVNKEGTNAT